MPAPLKYNWNKTNKAVFYFRRRTFEITHSIKNEKAAVKRFSGYSSVYFSFISVLFQLCMHTITHKPDVVLPRTS